MSIELNKVYLGKSEEVLKSFPENSIDSVVCDPPYGLSFMGKKWDYDVPSIKLWEEVFRVLKPGGHLLAFGGTRTYHRMVVNIEDAGFEIRDQIQWIYGSGFPKSMDVSKAIDKKAGVEREVIGVKYTAPDIKGDSFNSEEVSERKRININLTTPSTDAAKEWDGWGTALKPANEPICVARKPIEGTVAENVLLHGVGGININSCRVKYEEGGSLATNPSLRTHINGGNGGNIISHENEVRVVVPNLSGRFPANVIFDECAAELLDEQSGILKSGSVSEEGFIGDFKANIYGKYSNNLINPESVYGDSGGASRFFYVAKPDQNERDKGLLKSFLLKEAGIKNDSGRGFSESDPYKKVMRRNIHPTVKPITLMRYLVKMVTPKNGIVLDPFAGSGTTLIAAKLELMNSIGIEKEEEYIPLIEARLMAWNPDLYKPQELF